MYNIHQYNSTVRIQERIREEEEKYAKYLLKHQDFKEKAKQRAKEKAEQFIDQQQSTQSPFVFEDDHFIHWRRHRQYRDVEDHTKFLSFKSFRHKPYYEMDKYFNQRERREIKQLSARKEHLVRANIIPEEQRSRSLRCQGPLSPKIQFRQRKKDHEYLQPRLRFTNVTDRQRMNQSAMSYDDKFKSLYNSFSMTKSKIGRTTVSPKHERYRDNKHSFDNIDEVNSEMSKSKPFYFQREPEQDPLVPSLNLPSNLNSNHINPESSQMSSNSKNGGQLKTYFKLAKTIHLFSQKPEEKDKIDELLKRTQYERKKDLTNIRYNLRGENFVKKPVL